MKFNQIEDMLNWSIRRLSVGVASVVVASGLLCPVVGQQVLYAEYLINPTPLCKSCRNAASVRVRGITSRGSQKNAVGDVALPSRAVYSNT